MSVVSAVVRDLPILIVSDRVADHIADPRDHIETRCNWTFLQVNAGTIEIHDPELGKQLSLTTADLRFTDYLMQHVENYAVMEHDQNVGQLGQFYFVMVCF